MSRDMERARRLSDYKGSRILVTGGTGMVGRALTDRLRDAGHNVAAPTRTELDLRDRTAVQRYMTAVRPKVVFMLAARVGSIAANIADPAGFLSDNARINLNTFEAAAEHSVERAVYIGSSCLFPRDCPQPMREEYLMTGPIEPTNEAYGIGKLIGLKLAEYYRLQFGLRTISLMPAGVYGTGDYFDFERSHVLAALVRRFVEAAESGAPQVTLWGTGLPRREFIHVDDLVSAMLFLFDHYDSHEIINVGSGKEISIRDLAAMIASHVGYRGAIDWDASKPDGMPRKQLDVSRLTQLGFACNVSLAEGIARTVREYRKLETKKYQ
jgi:GDP-L-fucose synthase